MTYETVWSGTLERQQLCPSISGYLGGSTTYAAMQVPAESFRDVNKLLRAAQKVRSGPMPSQEDIRKRLNGGYTLKSTALRYQISMTTARRIYKTG